MAFLAVGSGVLPWLFLSRPTRLPLLVTLLSLSLSFSLTAKKPPEEELDLDDRRWTKSPEKIPQPPLRHRLFTFDHGLQRTVRGPSWSILGKWALP